MINWDKSNLAGTQSPVFLGLEFLLRTPVVRLGPKAYQSTRQAIKTAVVGRAMTTCQFASLLGKLKHWAQYMPRGRPHLRPIQRWFKDRWVQSHGRWSDVVYPDLTLVQHLQWFLRPTLWQSGIPLHPPTPQQDLFTDS